MDLHKLYPDTNKYIVWKTDSCGFIHYDVNPCEYDTYENYTRNYNSIKLNFIKFIFNKKYRLAIKYMIAYSITHANEFRGNGSADVVMYKQYL